ncbi:tRNA dihydrouridine(20/20a) synthase DusA [Streptobacillus felis]|uniref:tRNA-dihydrouridine synthase n=1 Tax=Streptobacillus felis TaxID=1384509 RepID=A0A7Z0T6N7_9FUSO|nr:tRNA dihydrouridine(20/20a) synthase DusA [Streptobacillus felis]NYV27411.1 tRNA dihydrouridine(20/20a) synthase DusA [Streptobacillus felis]
MYKVSLAPMVDRTDTHFRNFIRMINEDIELYTEMITTQAILNGYKEKILKKTSEENPVVLQIATSSLNESIEAAKIIKYTDYNSVNINVGCPSDRVSGHNMGAYLMSEPQLVRDIAQAVKEYSGKPVSIKNRIGIDGKGILENDRKIVTYEELLDFIDITNVDKYIVHARIAILKGLSPKENRTIPPLDYDMVYRLKKDRPNLEIEINGGIKTIEDIVNHHNYVDSVMIGRTFYDNPMLANEINKLNGKVEIEIKDILKKMFHYVKKIEENGEKPHHFLRHTLGLFYNTPYSKLWKNKISPTNSNSNDILEFLSIIV